MFKKIMKYFRKDKTACWAYSGFYEWEDLRSTSTKNLIDMLKEVNYQHNMMRIIIVLLERLTEEDKR